jgi:hypothetical protein
MKLSMWILFDELTQFNPRANIIGGKAEIEGVRFFSYDDKLHPNNVYIGYTSEFFGSNGEQVLLANGCDMIIIDHGDAAGILNIVLDIFEKYSNWDKRMKEARFTNEPYQAILDIAHEVFRCPMLFGCKNLQIYAITMQYPDAQVYEGWDEVKTIKTMPLWLIEYLSTLYQVDEYPDEVEPAVIPTWPSMKFSHQIWVNCYLDGAIWGHFLIYYKEKSVKPAILQLARHVADIFSVLLSERHEKSTMHSWLSDLLDGKVFEAGAFHTLFWSLHWSETDRLVLYRIMSSTMINDQMMFYWLCDSLSVQASNAIVFPYKDSIVVIVRDIGKQPQIVLDIIVRLLQLNEYHCGISFSFQGLENIQTYFRQAGYAITLVPDPGNKVHAFEECPLDGIAQEFRRVQNWKGWVSPALFRLIETDALQGTEYYATLYCYLINKCHIGNTAKSLYIHRNTIINRLEKIGNIMHLDLHDEDTLTYLRFCFSLMKDAYPAKVT